jgi:hypothetical protein
MRPLTKIKADPRVRIVALGSDGGACKVRLESHNKPAGVIFSWGGGWDHVSVSFNNRCPTWEEMCQIKDLFFEPDECVMQLHPPKKDYINNHPYCLHLWHPTTQPIPMPPKFMV